MYSLYDTCRLSYLISRFADEWRFLRFSSYVASREFLRQRSRHAYSRCTYSLASSVTAAFGVFANVFRMLFDKRWHSKTTSRTFSRKFTARICTISSYAFQISSLLFIYLEKKKKDCLAIFHSSANLDIASRNQIRKYATGTTVTDNIQLRFCLRAYWPPLEFPRMPRIRPRLLLFAYTSPQSLERLRDVASRACITTRNILRGVSVCRNYFVTISRLHCRVLLIFCRLDK